MNGKKSEQALSAYEQFLLSEYEHIATAHFNMVDTIATFFKHYLVIVSLPVPLLALILSGKMESGRALEAVKAGIPAVSALVALIGTCMLAYIANLWFDQALYSRTVNGVRNYFTRRSGLSFGELHGVRVLPISANVPHYHGIWYFIWVVFAFALINGTYFLLAVYLLLKWWHLYSGWHFYHLGALASRHVRPLMPLWVDVESMSLLAGLLFVAVNVGLYFWLVHFRERRYLNSCLIGVDIDGVLNCHREHFAIILNQVTGKVIDPKKITKIPVHKCEGLGVSAEDEQLVFNHPSYWREMPVHPDAQRVLGRLRKMYPSHQIRLFTGRNWPNFSRLPDNKRSEYEALWEPYRTMFMPSRAITSLTRKWLVQHKIPFDSLVVEHESRPNNTRFVQSDAGLIRAFIEDDPENMRRLALSCERVILLAQPYNEVGTGGLPENVVRVDSWEMILSELPALAVRKLSTELGSECC